LAFKVESKHTEGAPLLVLFEKGALPNANFVTAGSYVDWIEVRG
jgi:hypothetical protein